MGVQDSYLWLENIEDPAVVKWVLERDSKTREKLHKFSEKLEPRVSKYFSLPRILSVRCTGKGCFIIKREAMKFSIELLYREGDRRILVSSDEIGEGVIITNLYASQDGRLFAYFFTKGSDEGVLRIVETEDNEKIDEIEGVVGSIVFLNDGSYYYIRQYRKDRTPDDIEPPAERVFHRSDGSEEMVFGKGIPTQYHMWLKASSDTSRALLTLMHGWSSSKVYGGDLKEPAQWKHIYGTGEFMVNHINYSNGSYFIASYEGAGRGRVLSVREDGSINLLVGEGSHMLKDAALVEKELLLHYLVDCSSELVSFDLASQKWCKLPIERPGSITTISSELREAVLVFESFSVPFRLYRYSKGELKLLLSEELTNSFTVEECGVVSRDGTKVHTFVFRKDGVSTDKILLYGYGGFGISLTPTFSPGTVVFVEDGGTYVVANLRGGGEYGEEWHRAGMGRNKQNVFEDFIACAEYFKSKGAKMVAHGVSNGGLLVGAVLTQRPELLDGAVIGYPVLDMLRFHKLHVGKLWISEYGNPDDPGEKEYLLGYSPYHNIRAVKYPPVLAYTGLQDDRVHPAHALKFVAKLEEVGAMALLRVEQASGHMGAAPQLKAREASDILAFIYEILGLKPS